jgi:hypothetical protein
VGGSAAEIHNVTGQGETALIFQVGGGCREAIVEQQTGPVHLAGFDGVMAEPFEPARPFGNPDGGEKTRAHALFVGDRTLCVYLTWSPTTTERQLAAAAEVLDTLRAQPISDDLVRITFTLDEGWDRG